MLFINSIRCPRLLVRATQICLVSGQVEIRLQLSVWMWVWVCVTVLQRRRSMSVPLGLLDSEKEKYPQNRLVFACVYFGIYKYMYIWTYISKYGSQWFYLKQKYVENRRYIYILILLIGALNSGHVIESWTQSVFGISYSKLAKAEAAVN